MDMEALLAQANALQSKVNEAQEKLDKMHVKGISGNGACIIDMTGKYDLADIKISEDALSYGAGKVAELVSLAYRDAKAKADELIDKVMGEATAGIPMPEQNTGQAEKNVLL